LLHESSFVAHDAQRITLIHKKISQHLSRRSGFGECGIGIGWFAQREVVFLTFLDLSSDVWDIWKAMLAPSKKKSWLLVRVVLQTQDINKLQYKHIFGTLPFFLGPIAIHPTVGSTVGKKPTSRHRQASKAAKFELKVCSGIDFHIKTNLRTGKIGQILPFFFP